MTEKHDNKGIDFYSGPDGRTPSLVVDSSCLGGIKSNGRRKVLLLSFFYLSKFCARLCYILIVMITYCGKKAYGGHELIDAVQEKRADDLNDHHVLLARNLRPEHYQLFTHILFRDTDLRSELSKEVIDGLKNVVSIYEAMPIDQRPT